MSAYKSQAARDAERSRYGNRSYWDYLEEHAHELHALYTERGDTERADYVLTRSLSEALRGNDGD